MPSSLAAALAASKKTVDRAATIEAKIASVNPPARSSLTQHNDAKMTQLINNPAHKPDSKNSNSESSSPKQEAGKQTPNSKNRKGGGKSHHQPNHTRTARDDYCAAAGEEIVFLCDIPSDDDDYQECVEESRLDLDALVITDQRNARGKGRGRGGSGHNSARNNSIGNGGRILNVNASRRMIGHALGTRLGPASNNDRYGSQDGREVINGKRIEDRGPNNPGAMPTPWSKKTQELMNEKNKNVHGESRSHISRKNECCNKTAGRNNREFSQKFDRDKTDAMANDESTPSPMPKLESAVLKGRWADEDSSDDE
jgi:hypothetical protein